MISNELTIFRNESCAIEKKIEYEDGSPFIVPRLNNPYIRITISDSMSERNGYVKINYFLPWTGVTFLSSTVIDIRELTNESGQPLYDDFPSDLVLNDDNVFLTAYLNGQLIEFEPGDCLFCCKSATGRTHYKYWLDGSWHEYAFEFSATLDKDTLSSLVPKTYYYSIQLVSGTINNDVLVEDYCRVLLKPTKLYVLSNLHGGT